ncbi:MAG: lamin tail domain-containing protein [Verrucomicrobiia bacterium]
MENGLHRFENGRWIESDETIRIVPGGAAVDHAAFKVKFAANLNTYGAVEVLTPENKKINFHIIGLAFVSAASGKSVFFSKLKDCVGFLLPQNKILYQDAFDGENVKASVVYSVTKGGLSQNIIIQQLPTPANCGLIGESSEDIRLEIITEFIEFPPVERKVRISQAVLEPEKRRKMVSPDFIDEELIFGSMRMVRGTAYSADNRDEKEIPIYKFWHKDTYNNRQFLIEIIEWDKVKDQIKSDVNEEQILEKPVGMDVCLPKDGQIVRRFPTSPKIKNNSDKTMIVASVVPEFNGLNADFELVQSATNFVFKGDTTYYVPSSSFLLSGTTVFEGGTVIKFTNMAPRLQFFGPVVCQTDPYHPVIFTSKNDDSVGEIIAGSTGNPQKGESGSARSLELNDISTVYIFKNFKARYLNRVFALMSGTSLVVSDAQISDCNIFLYGYTTNRILVNNSLIYSVSDVFSFSRPCLDGVNLTLDRISKLNSSSIAANLTNCLLVAVTNNTNFVGVNNVIINNASEVFQNVGAGYHYLLDNSQYRGIGTTNICPELLSELRKRTTTPPLLITNQLILSNTLLQPRELCDNSPGIDLGYHYPVLDYIVDNLIISNATLFLADGVNIGISYSSGGLCGIWLENYGALNSFGTPTKPNMIVRLAAIQEMPTPPGYYCPSLGTKYSRSYVGDLRFRFTKFFLMAGPYYHFREDNWWCGSDNSNWHIRDCEFLGGKMLFKPNNVLKYYIWFNNLFNRVNIIMMTYAGIQWQVNNNLFYNGYFGLENYPGMLCEWLIINNLFDQTMIYVDNRITNLIHYNNGYVYGYQKLPGDGYGNVILESPPVYAKGPLGKYYYITNSPLIDAGSDIASDWGLYHYTTIQIPYAKEGNSIVDIGYHYVACGEDNRPIDSDNDGFEDWYEDTNGDGLYNSGDISDFRPYSDSDDDGLLDYYETTVTHTDPLKWDSDGDGISDAWEILHDINPNDPDDRMDDHDGDGISNINEYLYELKFIKPREPIGPCSRRTPLVISEIMYNPPSGKEEFIEIYNSHHLPHKLDGYGLFNKNKEEIYSFKNGTIINPNSYLIIKPKVNLAEKDKITLKNNLGAVLLEIEYSNKPPWPKESDGAGHSLVLARPSYGEGDPRAWAASAKIGGSPGAPEPEVYISALDYIKINEFLANGSSNVFIELYNLSDKPIDISGCYLSDNANNPYKFKIEASQYTTIPARGFLCLIKDASGSFTFEIDKGGEQILFTNPSRTRVLDAIRFEGQSYNITTGRYPDGTDNIIELAVPSPGTTNANPFIRTIVINEIMYHPIFGDEYQYIELYNIGVNPVNISGWSIYGDISYKFTNNVSIGISNYIVVCKSSKKLSEIYTNLISMVNLFGDWKEDLPIKMGKIGIKDSAGVIIDEVNYFDGGKWGEWADGSGSSLELINPLKDNKYGDFWCDSNDEDKSQWTSFEHTGYLDNGLEGAYPYLIEIFLEGNGECLIDDVTVIVGGTNYVVNSSFENGLVGWYLQGNHSKTYWETNAGYNSNGSMHLVANGRGDTAGNRICGSLITANLLNHGNIATISARAKWLKGCPKIVIRLHGNYLGLIGFMDVPQNLGTPGYVNSCSNKKVGVAINDVKHFPVLPLLTEPVLISAKIYDPKDVNMVILNYRIDPLTNYQTIIMRDDGNCGDHFAKDGVYSCIITNRTTNKIIAYYISVIDNKGNTNKYPAEAPDRECLIGFGEYQPNYTFGTYRMWISYKNITNWATRDIESNDPVDITFIYGKDRVINNATARYTGSPATRRSAGYNSPTGRICAYSLKFPKDDRILGSNSMELDWPIWDDTGQREQVAFWIAGELGLQYTYRRFVHLFVNGISMQTRGLCTGRGVRVYEDAQTIDNDFIEEWFSNNKKGFLYKFDAWFEFNPFTNIWECWKAPIIGLYLTTNIYNNTVEKKIICYRAQYKEDTISKYDTNFVKFFELVDALNTNVVGDYYTSIINSILDSDQWMRVFAFEDVIKNKDSFGNSGGKNMYSYLPKNNLKWNLLLFDLDYGLGGALSCDPELDSYGLFDEKDPAAYKLNTHPPFLRAYWRAIKDAVYGPLMSANINPILDENYKALTNNMITRVISNKVVNPLSPDELLEILTNTECTTNSILSLRGWIQRRREILLNEVNKLETLFEITNNNGNNFTTNNSFIVLTGTAPIDVAFIKINNGTNFANVSWTTVTNWSIGYILNEGENVVTVSGFDQKQQPLGYTDTIRITYQP